MLAITGLIVIPVTVLRLLTQGVESSTVQTLVAMRHSEITAIAGVVTGIGIGLVIASYIKTTDGSTKETELGVGK